MNPAEHPAPAVETRLTVTFDEPFWVGVAQRQEGNKLWVCKVTFGAEPTDAEVYAFCLRQYDRLRFSLPVKAPARPRADNPKRRQREAKKALATTGVGTKSQQALQLQREEGKLRRRERTRQEKEAEEQRQRALRVQKHKEKHRGH